MAYPPSVAGKDGGGARQAAIAIVLGFLTLEAVWFAVRDIGHFASNYVEAAWGGLWPNRFWLMSHVTGATIALFSGPLQLWSGLRDRHRTIHRWTGRLYVGGVVVGGITAFYLSVFVEPRNFGVALFSLGLAWWFTVGMAFRAIKQRRIETHKEWMIRGYVITYSFVTFRLWIGLPMWSTFGPARLAVVLWLSWIVPLLLTEVVVQSRRTIICAR